MGTLLAVREADVGGVNGGNERRSEGGRRRERACP